MTGGEDREDTYKRLYMDVRNRTMRDPWEISCTSGKLSPSKAREEKACFLFRARDGDITATL